MIKHVLDEKIKEFSIANVLDQENILQELMQQYILASLSRSGFFSDAVFHGGTCLRIAYGMNRFSEDLDFFLKQANPDFTWKKYLDRISKDAVMEGIHFDIRDKSKPAAAVQKAFLNTDSIGKDILLDLPFERDNRKLIKIKLEIDTKPPSGSSYETRYITFPLTVSLTTQTLESGFGMKMSALLCREYTKARDWYDFIWYISKKIVPDLRLLQNALNQQGPWAGQKIRVGPEWIVENLGKRITQIDWESVQQEIQRFLPIEEQESLKLWDQELFLHLLSLLSQYFDNQI
jgi:predicted nucleotidyltransferase component of viral defense system